MPPVPLMHIIYIRLWQMVQMIHPLPNSTSLLLHQADSQFTLYTIALILCFSQYMWTTQFWQIILLLQWSLTQLHYLLGVQVWHIWQISLIASLLQCTFLLHCTFSWLNFSVLKVICTMGYVYLATLLGWLSWYAAN